MLREHCGRGGRKTVQRIRELAVRLTLVTAEATFAKSPHHDPPNINWTKMMPTAWMGDSPQSKPTQRATDDQVKPWVREVALCRKRIAIGCPQTQTASSEIMLLLECVYHTLPPYNAKPILGLLTTLSSLLTHFVAAKPCYIVFHSHFPSPSFPELLFLPPSFSMYLLINNTATYFISQSFKIPHNKHIGRPVDEIWPFFAEVYPLLSA